MKVLMINTVETGKNGISTCINNCIAFLKMKGYEVELLTSEIDNNCIDQYQAQEIQVYLVTGRNSETKKYFIALYKILKRYNYDVVHVHGNSCTMSVELFAALLAGCKRRIAHSHNTACEHIVLHKVLRPLFEISCNRRLACGDAAGRWLYKNKPFQIITNSIYLEQYQVNNQVRTTIRNQLKITDNELLIGHIGLFNYQKNHEFIIEIAKRLMNLDCKFLFIGNGVLYKDIGHLIEIEKLQNKVICIGNINNVPDYLQAIDLFVLPSRFEGLPFVLIEAQAAGIPCIVSDKVAIEANICNELIYLPIDDAYRWSIVIENLNPIKLKESRIQRQIYWQKKLRDKGYDLKSNGELLVASYM